MKKKICFAKQPFLKKLCFLISGTAVVFSMHLFTSNLTFHTKMLARQYEESIHTLSLNLSTTVKYENISSIRPEKWEQCFMHNFELIITNDKICKLYENQTKIKLLILIFSSQSGFKSRHLVRNTWASFSKNNTSEIRHAFLFGKSNNETRNSLLALESIKYEDILQEDFIDTYQNLTYKTLMAFKWASSNCPVAEFILKTDHDMWVNIPQLMITLLKQRRNLLTGVIGECREKSLPVRERESKYYTSFKIFPHKHYPNFCAGTGYALANRVARNIYEISRNIPFFHLEDIYVAMCLKKLGYKTTKVDGFHSGSIGVRDVCVYKSSSVVTSHYLEPSFIKRIWTSDCHVKVI